MDNALTDLEKLHSKSVDLVKKYSGLQAKDIRRTLFEILSSQIAVSMISLKINMKFAETSKKEFEALLGSDPTAIDNYIFNFNQSLVESIIDTSLFQSELVLRTFYATLSGKSPVQDSVSKMTAYLYQDVENNWTKEEAKFVILFWALRNLIHTGGIYYGNQSGRTLNYKGRTYDFVYGKGPAFLKEGHALQLVTELFDSLDYLFQSAHIRAIPFIEHPNYAAVAP